jgi:hypothetical protein
VGRVDSATDALRALKARIDLMEGIVFVF